jgi:predicted RecA/RadA family phage recombinase
VEDLAMKNKVQDGKLLELAVGSTVVSGDPVVVGNAVRGVAQTSYDSTSGKAVIDTEGVFDLSVQAKDDAGNSAVAIGDRLYYTSTDTPVLSKKKSGKFFGVALETITSGSTATINVKVVQPSGVDNAAYNVVAGGIYTVNDSPLAAAEVIPVTGILDTDIVVCSMHTNGGTPKLNIISAVPSASGACVTVTADGTFTSGDKINYTVLRAAI